MPPPAPPAPARRDDAERRVRGRLMAKSLGQVLDRVRGAREVLPHLAALERGLAEGGTDALQKIAPHWLPKICSQLSSLPMPDADAPLVDLQERLLAQLHEHQSAELDRGFVPERTVVIREVSHTDFMNASAEQATTMLDPRA